MIVLDVLLGLNLVVLGVFALRGQTYRRPRSFPVRADSHAAASGSRGERVPGHAVIIPFPSRRSDAVARAMALHPSAGHRAPNHR